RHGSTLGPRTTKARWSREPRAARADSRARTRHGAALPSVDRSNPEFSRRTHGTIHSQAARGTVTDRPRPTLRRSRHRAPPASAPDDTTSRAGALVRGLAALDGPTLLLAHNHACLSRRSPLSPTDTLGPINAHRWMTPRWPCHSSNEPT